MKAISIQQPFASLIISGFKKIEFRTWKTKYRGRVLVHASKQKGELSGTMCDGFGIASKHLPKGKIIGSVRIDDCIKSDLDDNYEWLLSAPIRFNIPIEFKGSLRFFEVPNDLLKETLLPRGLK